MLFNRAPGAQRDLHVHFLWVLCDITDLSSLHLSNAAPPFSQNNPLCAHSACQSVVAFSQHHVFWFADQINWLLTLKKKKKDSHHLHRLNKVQISEPGSRTAAECPHGRDWRQQSREGIEKSPFSFSWVTFQTSINLVKFLKKSTSGAPSGHIRDNLSNKMREDGNKLPIRISIDEEINGGKGKHFLKVAV